MGRVGADEAPFSSYQQTQQQYPFQPVAATQQAPETIDDVPPEPFTIEEPQNDLYATDCSDAPPYINKASSADPQYVNQQHATRSPADPINFPPHESVNLSSAQSHPPMAAPVAFPPAQEEPLQAQAFPPQANFQSFPVHQNLQPQPQGFVPVQANNVMQFPQAGQNYMGRPQPPYMGGPMGQYPVMPAVNSPYVGLPMPQVQTEGWKTGLFECMNDPTNALITACFPCVTFGQIAEIIDSGNTSCGTSGLMYGLIAFLIGFPCIYSCTYRSKLRGRYGLIETPGPDWFIHCFCEWCALCQEYRELQLRGLDPALGWQGNQIKAQNMAMMMTPPPMQTMIG